MKAGRDRVTFSLRREDIEDILSALYGNLDLTFEPTLRRAEVLHEKFNKGLKIVALRHQADCLESDLRDWTE